MRFVNRRGLMIFLWVVKQTAGDGWVMKTGLIHKPIISGKSKKRQQKWM